MAKQPWEKLAERVVEVQACAHLTPSEQIDLISLLFRQFIPPIQAQVAAGMSYEAIHELLWRLKFDVPLIQQIIGAACEPSTPIPARIPAAPRSLRYDPVS